MDSILNMRDFGCCACGAIAAGKVYRTGCVSQASDNDIESLQNNLGIRTFIDLRSLPELDEDEFLHSEVYKGYECMEWQAHTRTYEPVSFNEDDKGSCGRKRYFISLIHESLGKQGIFHRMEMHTRLLVVALYPFSLFSNTVDKYMRELFINSFNNGGLKVLNELILDLSGAEIFEVLKLMADKESHPIALYCTAGKDRTG